MTRLGRGPPRTSTTGHSLRQTCRLHSRTLRLAWWRLTWCAVHGIHRHRRRRRHRRHTGSASCAHGQQPTVSVPAGCKIHKTLGCAAAAASWGGGGGFQTAPLERLFAVRLRLGIYDPPQHDPLGYQSFSWRDIDRTAHNGLALRAAVGSSRISSAALPPSCSYLVRVAFGGGAGQEEG